MHDGQTRAKILRLVHISAMLHALPSCPQDEVEVGGCYAINTESSGEVYPEGIIKVTDAGHGCSEADGVAAVLETP